MQILPFSGNGMLAAAVQLKRLAVDRKTAEEDRRNLHENTQENALQ